MVAWFPVRVTRPNPRVEGQVIEATSVDAVLGFLETVFFTQDGQLITVRNGFQFSTGNTFQVGTSVNTQVTINAPQSLTMTNVSGTIAPLLAPQPFSNSRIEVTFTNSGTVTYNLPLIGTPKTSRIIQLTGIRGNLTIPPTVSLSLADRFVPNNKTADGESNDSPLSISRILPSLTSD